MKDSDFCFFSSEEVATSNRQTSSLQQGEKRTEARLRYHHSREEEARYTRTVHDSGREGGGKWVL